MRTELKSALVGKIKAWKKAAKRRALLIVGGIRCFFKHCPACNDDAPELYECKVCEQWAHKHRFHCSGSDCEFGWPAPEKQRRKWWQRFKYLVGTGTFD